MYSKLRIQKQWSIMVLAIPLLWGTLLHYDMQGYNAIIPLKVKTVPYAMPTKPQPLSPANHAVLYDTTDIGLDWSDVPNATAYTAEVRWQGDQVALCDHVEESRCHIGHLVIAVGFRWHVEAFNAEGGSGQTEDWQFDVIVEPTPVSSANVFLPIVSR